MAFKSGQTFLYPLRDNQTAHLWVIATEPADDGSFAFVSFTSLKDAKDQTIILRKAEHPFLKQDTCICYALAEITTEAKLQACIDCGEAKPHKDVDGRILEEILSGFTASNFTKNRIRRFVKDYRDAVKLKEKK